MYKRQDNDRANEREGDKGRDRTGQSQAKRSRLQCIKKTSGLKKNVGVTIKREKY